MLGWNDQLGIALRNKDNDDVATLLRHIEEMSAEIARGERLLGAIRSCERDLYYLVELNDDMPAPVRDLAATLLEAVI